jgi:hypothetical protein
MKKLFLLLLFLLNVNHSNAQIMPEPGVQFLVASGLTLFGTFSTIFLSKIIEKIQNLQAIKDESERKIKSRGGQIKETTDYHSNYYGTYTVHSTVKNWRLILPDYPNLDDLHVISTNWNKYMDVAPEIFKTSQRASGGLIVTFFSFVGAAILYGDLILNPPYSYRY